MMFRQKILFRSVITFSIIFSHPKTIYEDPENLAFFSWKQDLKRNCKVLIYLLGERMVSQEVPANKFTKNSVYLTCYPKIKFESYPFKNSHHGYPNM